jgi:hypothetical protein
VAIAGLRGGLPLPALDAGGADRLQHHGQCAAGGQGLRAGLCADPFLQLAVRRDGDAALDRDPRPHPRLCHLRLAALWERGFPGLTNFASDYRTSALFWEMHVGGAALDAWLMLSFPFAVLSFRRAHGVVGRALALVVVGVGIYAMFTTFSRIVYGALFVSMAVLGVASLRRPAAHRPADRPRAIRRCWPRWRRWCWRAGC